MEERTKTIAAITILAGIVALVVIVIGIFINERKTISPVPPEASIKIIFVSPSPVPPASSSATVSPTGGQR